MRLYEYQGKQLFHEAGIPIPGSTLIHEVDASPFTVPYQRCVVKAQVLSGKRKKRGLITAADNNAVDAAVKDLLGRDVDGEHVSTVLVEEAVDIKKEYYLSFSVNRETKGYTLLFSNKGGINIEDVAENHIVRKDFYNLNGDVLSLIPGKLRGVAEKLFQVFVENDCMLAEINPVAETPRGITALDSKIVVDDNALYRHEEFERSAAETEAERRAEEAGLHYVPLDGDIGIIGNGAGLVLATLDAVKHFGGTPANFLDVGGGASTQGMETALDIVLHQDVSAVFINIFGGITHCDDIANGLVHYRDTHELDTPLVVRVIGTNDKEARKILEENGIHAITSMEQGAEKTVQLAQSKGDNRG